MHISPRCHTLKLLRIALLIPASRQRLNHGVWVSSRKEWDRVSWWTDPILQHLQVWRRNHAMHSAAPAFVAPALHKIANVDEHCVRHRWRAAECAFVLRVFGFETTGGVLEEQGERAKVGVC